MITTLFCMTKCVLVKTIKRFYSIDYYCGLCNFFCVNKMWKMRKSFYSIDYKCGLCNFFYVTKMWKTRKSFFIVMTSWAVVRVSFFYEKKSCKNSQLCIALTTETLVFAPFYVRKSREKRRKSFIILTTGLKPFFMVQLRTFIILKVHINF